MQTTISITRKWQIHIPKAARKALKMGKPGIMEVRTRNGKLILTPTKSKILQMAAKYNKYTKNKKVNLNRIRDYIDYSRT